MLNPTGNTIHALYICVIRALPKVQRHGFKGKPQEQCSEESVMAEGERGLYLESDLYVLPRLTVITESELRSLRRHVEMYEISRHKSNDHINILAWMAHS